MASPLLNGRNGESDSRGRFAQGNPGGPGNPYARRVARLRVVLLDAVTDEDLDAIVTALVDRAKSGDVSAAREILNRLVGKPGDSVDPDRLDVGERSLASDLRMQDLIASIGG